MNRSITTVVEGIPVGYDSVEYQERWEPVFEKWLPWFVEHGWTELVDAIEVVSSVPYDGWYRNSADVGGMYCITKNNTQQRLRHIYIGGHDPEEPHDEFGFYCNVTKEGLLVHEMTHAKHIRDVLDEHDLSIPIGGRSVISVLPEPSHEVLRDTSISRMEASNSLEMVATISQHAVQGGTLSDEVWDEYYRLGGPHPSVETGP